LTLRRFTENCFCAGSSSAKSCRVGGVEPGFRRFRAGFSRAVPVWTGPRAAQRRDVERWQEYLKGIRMVLVQKEEWASAFQNRSSKITMPSA